MDSSPQSASSISDEFRTSLPAQQEGEEAEQHIHMPNPSYWPLLLSLSVVVSLGAILLLTIAPLVFLVAVVCVFICILGWGLENPMAPLKEKFDLVYQAG